MLQSGHHKRVLELGTEKCLQCGANLQISVFGGREHTWDYDGDSVDGGCEHTWKYDGDSHHHPDNNQGTGSQASLKYGHLAHL